MTHKEEKTPKQGDQAKRLDALIKRSERGDDSAMRELRPLLKTAPDILSKFGQLAENTQRSLVTSMAGDNLIFQEGLLRRLDGMRQELAGANPTPLETILVERIVTCWLEVEYFDALYAQNMKDTGFRAGDYMQRRVDRAHRRLLSAAKSLAVIRRLQLPVMQVNIGEKQVNVASSGKSLPPKRASTKGRR